MDSLADIAEKSTLISEGAIETDEVPVLKIEKKVQELKDRKKNEVVESVKKENEEKSSLFEENVKENMEYLYRAQNIDLTQKTQKQMST